MSTLTRTHKIILIVFFALDIVVVAGMAVIIITALRNTAKPTPVAVATVTRTTVIQPTWTPTPSYQYTHTDTHTAPNVYTFAHHNTQSTGTYAPGWC
jgi:hypothetical protein